VRLLGNLQLAVSPETGTLLYLLARSSKARSSIEFGTSIGISTLHLAAALRDNGGGRLISTEFEPSKIAQARANIAAAGLSDLVEIREGDALETLARDSPGQIDLVLLDGAKALYPPVLALLEARLRPGAMIGGRQCGLVLRVLVNSTSRGRRLPFSAICKRRRIVNDGLSIAVRQSNPTTKRLMRWVTTGPSKRKVYVDGTEQEGLWSIVLVLDTPSTWKCICEHGAQRCQPGGASKI
jgi:hypothetical protein